MCRSIYCIISVINEHLSAAILYHVSSIVWLVCYFVVLYTYTAPTETPLNVSVTVETSRDITLSWDRPSLEEQNGILTIYHVIIMETQILYLDNGTVISSMGENFNRTYNVSEGRIQLVDMLHPSYNYTVRIAAATAAGIGPFNDPITVMTLEDGECYVLLLAENSYATIYFTTNK